MADKFASEAVRSLHKYKFGVRADLTERFATGAEPGRADLMIVRGGFGGYIEIKGGRASFDLREYRQNQRQWAYQHAITESATPVWIWFYLGEDAPNRNPDKYNPRKTWLFPAEHLLYVESRLAGIQNTLPYLAKKGMKREVQAQNLDAITLLAGYELLWAGGGIWDIPTSHPFYASYIEAQPIFDLTGAANLFEQHTA